MGAKISYKLQAASCKWGIYKRFKETYKKPACRLKLVACRLKLEAGAAGSAGEAGEAGKAGEACGSGKKGVCLQIIYSAHEGYRTDKASEKHLRLI
jgi:hypothetical protein